MRINGKSGAIQGKGSKRPPLHLSVVAIEKGAFWSPSTKGRQLYLLFFTCIKYSYLIQNNFTPSFHGIKYSYLIHIIFKTDLFLTHRCGTTTLGFRT